MFENAKSIAEEPSQNTFQTIEDIDANALLSPYDAEVAEGSKLCSLDNTTGNQEKLMEKRDISSGKNPPHVDMQFFTEDEAWNYYNIYAEREGFSIRKSTSARGKDGTIIKRLFVCNKEGFKSLKDKREIGREIKRRKNEREGCMARMIIHKTNDQAWTIKAFDDVHNHELLKSPGKVKLLRSHNRSHLDKNCKTLVDQFSSCGVGPAKISRLLNATSTDTLVNITPQQCVEHLRVKRKNNVGHECISVLQQFLTKQAVDYQFYYAIETDEEGVCRSIFWADGHAKTTYLRFGDAIVFDVTYKTNSFLLPFAPFTGVNHHRQSTLFGCALLADEKEDTFVWLFENWLKCMWGKAPGAIITDQDQAICNAVKRVFPSTHHRYCIWHISLHEDEHLRSLRASYNPTFDEDYYSWVRKSKTIEEAKSRWLTLNEKYRRNYEEPLSEKQKNELKAWNWLENMYNKRHHWIEAYLKNTFFAGMRSSQRSESMNSFFDGYMNSTTPLYEFIGQYDEALESQRKKEEREDTFCMRTKPDFRGMHELEAHAGRIYTRNLFNIFQVQFKNTFHCQHERVCTEDGTKTYKVLSRVDGKIFSHCVQCNKSEETFSCTCAKFETEGMLCTHILYIMKQKFDMQSIPSRYILQRWTLDARFSTSSLGCYQAGSINSNSSNAQISPLQQWSLRTSFDKIMEVASRDQHLYDVAFGLVENFWKQYNSTIDAEQASLESTSTQLGPNAIITLDSELVEGTIRDTAISKTKGRPRVASRIPSGIQASQAQAQTRKRTCSTCGQKGHDMRTCSRSKMQQGQDEGETEAAGIALTMMVEEPMDAHA